MARKPTDLSIIKKPRFAESPNLPKTVDGVPDHNIDGFPLLLDQIDFFEHNPREAENPEYENIKESIRNTGLQQSLVVTKRPDEDLFSLFYGGNTRLKILQELYKETRDKKFYNLKVNYRPFTSVSNVIANHMSENENHGGMLFIDKAKGATDFKRFYEKENEVTLSARKLSAALQESGWSVSRTVIALYIYAIEHLSETIPNCLSAGMGKPKIGELRKYVTAIKTYADFMGEDLLTEEVALKEWYEELSESDEPDLFNAEAVFSRFAYRLTRHVKKSHTEVEAQLQHILSEGIPYDGQKKYIEVPQIEQPQETTPVNAVIESHDPKLDSTSAAPPSHSTSFKNSAGPDHNASEQRLGQPVSNQPFPGQTQTPQKIPVYDLMLMVHDLINRSPLLVEKGVLTPSRKPPFFELDEEWVKLESGNTKQLLADIKNAKNHVDHARYTLYRFIKIWTVYKLFLNHDYTSDQVRARGLFDAMENFNAYIVMQGFLDLYPKTSRKSKLKFIRELNEVGLVDLNQEINLIESTMELYFA